MLLLAGKVKQLLWVHEVKLQTKSVEVKSFAKQSLVTSFLSHNLWPFSVVAVLYMYVQTTQFVSRTR